MREQLDRFDGDLEKALAAYNAGPGRVIERGRHPAHSRNPDLRRLRHGAAVEPFPESRVDAFAYPSCCRCRAARFPPPRRRRAPIPPGSGPIVAALAWLQGTLLGNVATAVAVMAVAAVGFMMLTGRMNWRFGATVIIGCFILFGAASIVAGIQSAAAVG